ncbi:MAG TPA: hypothetical protein VHD63_03910 [Ktedonobacteraceae bacterium]|jgi:hypothetical protein|nr:hypothetical protein [Ktedonobacteraceae bacterium]
MAQHDMQQVRELARSLAKRAWTDEDFRQQIQDNPVETLTSAGLPGEFAEAFLHEAQLSEVSAYGLEQQCLISDIGLLQDFIY